MHRFAVLVSLVALVAWAACRQPTTVPEGTAPEGSVPAPQPPSSAADAPKPEPHPAAGPATATAQPGTAQPGKAQPSAAQPSTAQPGAPGKPGPEPTAAEKAPPAASAAGVPAKPAAPASTIPSVIRSEGAADEPGAQAPADAAPSGRWTQPELEAVSAEIAAQVEKMRGWKFKEPVAVKVTDKAGFLHYAKEHEEKLVTDEMKVRDETVAKLLGMLRPEFDVDAEMMKLLEEQVGGFYDPTSKTFFLMEQFTGGVAKVILAHELTHALDDQHFGLEKGIQWAIELGTDPSCAYAAVVEGSGTQVMQLWALKNMDEIDPKDLEQAGSVGSEALQTAPPYLWKPLIASYLKGQYFLSKAKGKKPDAVKRAFEDPPRSTEQILHPEKYWKDDQRDEPVGVTFPAIPTGGWQVLGQDTLGELMLAIATTPLGDRKGLDVKNTFAILGMKYTNDAAQGWGGDRLVLLGRGDDRRLQLVTVWDTEKDAREFADAISAILRAVVSADPPRAAETWRPGLTPTGFRVFAAAGKGELASRTVVITVVSSSAASALEQPQWLEESALVPWNAEPAKAR